jgi:hypothetical protein
MLTPGAAVEHNIAVNESMILLQMKETMGQSVSQVPQVFVGPAVFVDKNSPIAVICRGSLKA